MKLKAFEVNFDKIEMYLPTIINSNIINNNITSRLLLIAERNF